MNNPTIRMQRIADAFTYSEKVEKEAVAVIIKTRSDLIAGYIHVRPIVRLIDTLLNSEKFIAVTNATVYNPDGQIMFRTNFLTLNRDEITYLIPQNEMPGHVEEARKESSEKAG